ncbi:MAG: HEAT repeat domain-containing protein [Planctomycetota bacterium]
MVTFVGVQAGESAAETAQAEAHGASKWAGQWLVDYGRTVGLRTLEPTAADAERVLVWMEAAARVSPDLAEAYLWQYDLLNRLSRPEAALAALNSYCKLYPEDVSAQLDLIDRKFERCQTVSTRLAFCAETLEAGGLSPLVQSDLHRRRAELLMRSGDTAQAEAHATQAVAVFGGNVPAHELLVALADAAGRPARQVRMLLAALSASPGRAEEMWRLARLLDDLSLHGEAAKWYEHMLTLAERLGPGAQVPVELWIDFATCYADDGRYEQAAVMAERAVSLAPDALAARFLLVDIARKTGRTETADSHQDVLRQQFSGLEAATLGPNDLGRAYEAAWYYLRYEPTADRALRFASRARELAPDRPEVQVVYGMAKLAAGETAEVAALLEPWAQTNPWAAAALGEAWLAQGRADEAVKVWRAGEALRYSGRAYERIVAALAAQQQEPAPMPPHAAVVEALRGFDERVLSFPFQPAEALRFEVLTPRKEWAYGDPWVCEVRLTNTAAFPISMGEQQMVAGQVLVSVRWGDQPEQQLINYLPLSLALKPVLAPKERVTLTQTLDVGPVAALAKSTPQQGLALRFSFLLDPVVDQGGGWASAFRDFPPVIVEVKRVSVDASRAGVQALVERWKDGAEPDRVKAARTLAALIAERERARKAPLDYPALHVDELKLRRLLLSALAEPVPLWRAAVLDSLRTVELNSKTLEQVAPFLSDADWLVRLTTLDVLGETQGNSFKPVLERLSTADPDDLVRRLASLRLKLSSAAGRQ